MSWHCHHAVDDQNHAVDAEDHAVNDRYDTDMDDGEDDYLCDSLPPPGCAQALLLCHPGEEDPRTQVTRLYRASIQALFIFFIIFYFSFTFVVFTWIKIE